jgi:ABC-type phosphate/phosphonate transport system substrate-binding protein
MQNGTSSPIIGSRAQSMKLKISYLIAYTKPAVLCLLLMLLNSCKGVIRSDSSSERDGDRNNILRISEEPWRPQDQTTRIYTYITSYLQRGTGGRIAYQPALSYAHLRALFKAGQIDIAVTGILGAYIITKENPAARIIAVETPSFISVLVENANHRDRSVDRGTQDEPQVIKGWRVGFGSRSSGATYLYPLMDMLEHGVQVKDLQSCSHEPSQYLLIDNVAEGVLDFAFISGHEDEPLQKASESQKHVIRRVWQSEPRQNIVIIAGNRLLNPDHRNTLSRIQNSLKRLDPNNPEHKEVLDGLDVRGLLEPKGSFPNRVFARIAKAIEAGIDLNNSMCK